MRHHMRRRHSREIMPAVAENPLDTGNFVETAVGVAGGILLANVVVWLVQGISGAISTKAA
jgi:hypothetical protein